MLNVSSTAPILYSVVLILSFGRIFSASVCYICCPAYVLYVEQALSSIFELCYRTQTFVSLNPTQAVVLYQSNVSSPSKSCKIKTAKRWKCCKTKRTNGTKHQVMFPNPFASGNGGT